jgi:drug/metabolite transporter (DMT)-like permease
MRATRAGVIEWVVLLGLVTLWGSAFAGLKIAVETIPPLWVVVIRLGVATAVTFALLPLLKTAPPALRRHEGRGVWFAYLGVGLMGTALPFFLFAWSSARIDSAIVGICNGASPFVTAALAHFLVAGERINARRFLGLICGFAGLAVLVAPTLLAGATASAMGAAAAIAGAVCFACANIATRQAPRISAPAAAAIGCLGGFVGAGALALLTTPWATGVSSDSLAACIALGVGPTAIASVGYFWLIQRRGPVFVSYTTYLVPIWATAVGAGLMGEALDPTVWAALGLVLAGLWFASGAGPLRRSAPPPP